jgi:methyl-accepting chemotaxis protein
MKFNNLKLAVKLRIGSGAILFLLILLGILSLVLMNKMSEKSKVVSDNSMPSTDLILNLKSSVNEIRTREYRHLVSFTDEEKNETEKKINETVKFMDTCFLNYEKLISSDEEALAYKKFRNNWDRFFEIHKVLISISRKNLTDSAKNLIKNSSLTYFNLVKTNLDSLIEINVQNSKEAVSESNSLYKLTINITIIFIAISFILSILMVYITEKSIKKDVGGEPSDISMIAQEIASGNLTIETQDVDETEGIYNAICNMKVKLIEIINTIKLGAENIADASRQVSNTSVMISEGASEQAASVEEISSSMEEMTSNIQQNAENANRTEEISIKAVNSLNEMITTSLESFKSIKNIADKIKIINDIAFQTNILALNAAVEAARAGEHGKGFAVVASEVRKLAEKSKIAADEINLEASKSVKITEKSNELLNEIVPEIKQTSNLIKEISAACNEQNSGSEQINNSINGLNQVTQQAAAASEELATSSEELANQANELKDAVMYFNV